MQSFMAISSMLLLLDLQALFLYSDKDIYQQEYKLFHLLILRK